ncbi:MAG: hypothetical protein J7L69_02395 [Desulfobulbaceae bacterium]|nr:hypothetical protein [Desulfobulbaceae bacterium]
METGIFTPGCGDKKKKNAFHWENQGQNEFVNRHILPKIYFAVAKRGRIVVKDSRIKNSFKF